MNQPSLPHAQRPMIERVYRAQIWLVLILGCFLLLPGIASVLILASNADLGLAGLGVIFSMLFSMLGVVFLVAPSITALKSKTVVGWWMHFASLVALTALAFVYYAGQEVTWTALLPIVLPLSALILGIALGAKRSLFGRIEPLSIIASGILLIALAFPQLVLTQVATVPYLAELQPVGDVTGRVVIAGTVTVHNGVPLYKSDNGSASFPLGGYQFEVPDTPSADWFDSWEASTAAHAISSLPTNDYYHIWLTNAQRTQYISIASLMVVRGESIFGGDAGFVSTYKTIPNDLLVAEYPIVVLSREPIAMEDHNNDIRISNEETQRFLDNPDEDMQRTYRWGREQALPTTVLFEGEFRPVTAETRPLYESLIPVIDPTKTDLIDPYLQ